MQCCQLETVSFSVPRTKRCTLTTLRKHFSGQGATTSPSSTFTTVGKNMNTVINGAHKILSKFVRYVERETLKSNWLVWCKESRSMWITKNFLFMKTTWTQTYGNVYLVPFLLIAQGTSERISTKLQSRWWTSEFIRVQCYIRTNPSV